MAYNFDKILFDMNGNLSSGNTYDESHTSCTHEHLKIDGTDFDFSTFIDIPSLSDTLSPGHSGLSRTHLAGDLTLVSDQLLDTADTNSSGPGPSSRRSQQQVSHAP